MGIAGPMILCILLGFAWSLMVSEGSNNDTSPRESTNKTSSRNSTFIYKMMNSSKINATSNSESQNESEIRNQIVDGVRYCIVVAFLVWAIYSLLIKFQII